MVNAEILNSHPLSTLKKEISKTNIKGYSRMKKPELVATMMKHKERFGHIKHSGKTARVAKAPAKEPEKKKKEEPKPKKETSTASVKKVMKEVGLESPKASPKKKEEPKPAGWQFWDDDVKKLYKKNGGTLPRTRGEKVLYFHDFFNTDGSTTLSRRRTKNYNVPVYVREDDGYRVGKNKWRDYSWDD